MSARLLGSWRAAVGERHVDVSYESVSGGSALLETWRTSSGETVSVYHAVGEHLAVTHYCGQGNQAYLVATEAAPDELYFQRSRVTGWREGTSVLDELRLALVDDILVRTEVYVDHSGQAETTVLRFSRLPAPDAAARR